MKMLWVKIVIAAAVASAALVGGVYWRGRDASEPAADKAAFRQVPDLTFQDYQGREVRLADFRGKPILVNSWAAWCPFCKEELKDFAAAQREFGDKAAIVAVDRAESADTAKKYSDDLGVSGDLVFLLDPDDSFYRAIGGFSMPETIFVDSEGMIRFHKRGPMPLEEIRRRIEELIKLQEL